MLGKEDKVGNHLSMSKDKEIVDLDNIIKFPSNIKQYNLKPLFSNNIDAYGAKALGNITFKRVKQDALS